MSDSIKYIIKIDGYSKTPGGDNYWKPYLKSFDVYLYTTDDPWFARAFKKKETAQKYAEKAEKYLKDELRHSHPNISVSVLEVELKILGSV